MSRVALILAALALGAAAAPVAAQASEASKSGNVITITGGPEANDITVTSECCYYTARIADTAGITAGAGCTQSTSTLVDCGSTRPNPDVVVTLGDGSDRLSVNASPELRSLSADGGPGDDRITTDGTADVVHGGDGNDTIGTTAGEDQAFGDAGNDIVNGGSSSDTVSGGPGQDRIEGDGSISCCWGDDRIDARDGEMDQVSCGLGSDIVTADSGDVIESGECESVDAGPAAGPGPGAPPAGGSAFSIGLASKATGKISKLISRSGFAFVVRVSEACRATLKITVGAADARRLKLGRGALTLASATEAIPEAGDYAGHLAAAAKFRAKLRKLRRVPTTLSFACVSASESQRASRKVTFTR
jgi:hypothetical protein